MATAQTELLPLAIEIFYDGRPWAITPGAIQSMLRAAAHPDLNAVAARIGTPLDDNRAVRNYNGAAVIGITGPLVRYRSIWTWLLGGTSVDDTALALHAALDDPSVSKIVLAVNSPGGQIDGINELANMIRAANAVKPVTAYVDGMAASGAYWLASAAGKIVADETAQLGSIGVLATVVDDRESDERRGVKRFEVVSSQSPLKRTDPATDAGRDQLQQMVDAMAKVFIQKVAGFRGTSEDRVAADFGRGAVMPAGQALLAGMADSLGSLESLLEGGMPMGDAMRRISDKPGLRVDAPAAQSSPAAAEPFDEEELDEDTEGQELNDDSSCDCPEGEECECEDDDEDESEGTEQEPDDSSVPEGEGKPMKVSEVRSQERQRIDAIVNCDEAKGRETLARTLALETNQSVDAAKKLLAAAPVASKTNALEARMAELPNPKVGVSGDAQDDTPTGEAARVLAFVPKERKRVFVQ